MTSAVFASRTRRPPARGLRRERLDVLMSRITEYRLTTVVAPAGSGKTTALAHYADGMDRPVAWYTVDSLDDDTAFLGHLQHAIENVLGLPPAAPWTSANDVVECLVEVDRPTVIVVDDLHLVRGTPAEQVLADVVLRLPAGCSLVVGSRSMPQLPTARLEVMDEVLVIGTDDLRFRTWEAEQLLGEIHGLLLGPDDVAHLTRRVGGWAAGFQLFQLAARDKSPADQRRLAGHSSILSPLTRRYLAQNMLHALSDDTRDFLLQTSMLGTVTAEIADDLLGCHGSAARLGHLESSELFVTRLDEATYRYHEVLRSYLEGELRASTDPDLLRTKYRRAGELLEAAGHLGEAIRCYVRADERAGIERLAPLARPRTIAASGIIDATEDIPATGDPWLLLFWARTSVTSGRFRQARTFYREAESQSGSNVDLAAICRMERADIESLVDPIAPPPRGWLQYVRLGLTTNPGEAVQRLTELGDAESLVAAGALLLLIGDFGMASQRFEDALLTDAPPDWVIDAGRLGRQFARVLTTPSAAAASLPTIDRLLAGLDNTWMGRIGAAIYAATSRPLQSDVAPQLAGRCDDDGDPWGAILTRLCAGVSAERTDDARAYFQEAAELAERQQSPVLISASLAGLAVLSSGDRHHADHAEQLAKRCGLRRPPFEMIQQRLSAAEHSPAAANALSSANGHGENSITTRCFGTFSLGPVHVAIDALRPQARAVLMRLATEVGRMVRCDTLIDELWADDSDERTTLRSLQVTVSAIRRALTEDTTGRTIERVGAGYSLTDPPSGGDCDLVLFRRRATEIITTRDDGPEVVVASERALSLQVGELLPEAGNAEWILALRNQVDRQAALVAARGAQAAIATGDLTGAIRLGHLGLEFDRYDDALWRILLDAHERRGDVAVAGRLRAEYERLLDELGVGGVPTLTDR